MSSKSAAVDEPLDPRDTARVAEAVEQIQRGERLEENCKLLFLAFEPALRSFLRRRKWPEGEVEDLIQEAMLRVYKGIGSFSFKKPFHHWILRIVNNTWKNAVRTKVSNKPEMNSVSLDDALSPDKSSGPALDEPVAPDKSPLDLALAAERRQLLRAAFDKLSPRVGQCMRLRSYGYKNKEIAELLGTSADTVKAQVQEGLKRLRELLAMLVLGLSGVLILLLR